MDYSAGQNGGHAAYSARKPADPKNVRFELVSAESPQYRARLPMRVQIFPHDTTDSIVTTVKNFYGLYSSPTVSKGVSFEDDRGNTLIARYENFTNGMVVYVRVIEEPTASPHGFASHHPASVVAQTFVPDGFSLQPPSQFGSHISRPGSRTSRKRSQSPGGGRGRRSESANTNPKARSRSAKTRIHGGQADGGDSMNGYSSGDGAPGSSSGKSKEQLGNTDISLENIVEGGRRKRAKFESSELPLFAPPQMPAATSANSNPSVSPARRAEHRASLPFVHPGANPFSNPRVLQSPQGYNNHFGQVGVYATPVSDGRRHRGSIGYPPGVSMGPGMGILPTPDPTVGSAMSEEDKDVAMQLMRLGDISHISHGRTSASTQDDTFSGRAAASSTGASSDEESASESESDELPAARKQRLDVNGNSKKIYETTESHFMPARPNGSLSGDEADYHNGFVPGSMAAPNLPKPSIMNGLHSSKPKPMAAPKVKSAKPIKPKQASSGGAKIKKSGSVSIPPMSPTSLPASRKPSIASNVALSINGEDETDLSSKPRCQRCRKSKKGCDRQRPCGRCKDAGIPADQCISEDEGNGRKGRYGRHMGVPIKKEDVLAPPTLLPAAPIATNVAMPSTALMPQLVAVDKNKKRKR